MPVKLAVFDIAGTTVADDSAVPLHSAKHLTYMVILWLKKI